MLILASTSDLLDVVTTTTQAVDVHASWVDNAAGTINPGNTNSNISSAATTHVVGSPGLSTTFRNIRVLTIMNKGASSNGITVNHVNGSATARIISLTLQAGEELHYNEANGWTYYSAAGLIQLGAITYGSATFSSASPTGNVSTTEKAMGLGATFVYTPAKTGNMLVILAGIALNATAAGDGTNITGRFGTGTAPINGATSGLGTQISIPQHFIASTTAGQQGFMVVGKVTGQVIGTALWFDVSLLAVTGGGSTVKDVQFFVMEVP